MKGVENMVSQTLELKYKKIRQEAAQEAEQRAIKKQRLRC